MKQPDCAFNIDVKNSHIFQDPVTLRGVMPRQREEEMIKTPVYQHFPSIL